MHRAYYFQNVSVTVAVVEFYVKVGYYVRI